MFDALRNRFFGARRAPETAPPVALVAAPPPAREQRAANAAGAALVGVGARRPLVSAQGALAGFEFHAGAIALNRMRRSEDAAAAVAYTANVLGAMRLCTGQGLVALAELPAAWLGRCERDDAFAPGMHLLLRADAPLADAAAAAGLVERLRANGAAVGWNPAGGVGMPPGRPDFMQVRAPVDGDAAAWRAVIARAAQASEGVPQLLLDLPGVDVMEAVLAPPVLLAACVVAPCAVPSRVQALPPQAQRLLRLLERLLRDDDNVALVQDIKSDAALSLRLLQHLNSAGASPGRVLDSIEQAVMVLGRDALYRWVAQMLVRMAPPRPAADALQAMALARARLLELLARTRGAASPGSLYLLGLASMLPLLLQCSLEDAAHSMSLAPDAMQALQQHSGPWQPYLALLEALERNDLAAAEAEATPFGGLDAVLACWTQAWRSA